MKTILVDAWNTFVTGEGVFQELYNLLETFDNKKLILTNANDEQLIKLGIIDMPYEVFTLKHSPDKVDPLYYEKMLEKYELEANEVLYFEHNKEAVKSAESINITTFHYDKDKKDLIALQSFLDENLN